MLYFYNMSIKNNSKQEDRIFKALANRERRQILDLIKDTPLSTGKICHRFKKLNRCTVMLHLSVLERADLVISKREGRNRLNYINVVPVQRIYNRWISQIAASSASFLAQIQESIGPTKT